MLRNMSRSYELVDANGLFLGSDVEPYERACHKFLVNYCALSKLCADADVKQCVTKVALYGPHCRRNQMDKPKGLLVLQW